MVRYKSRNNKGRFVAEFQDKTKQRCSRCKKIKPLEDFHKDRKRRLGHCYECKECRKAWYNRPETIAYYQNRFQEGKEKNRTKRTEAMRKWRRENPEKARIINLRNARRRQADGRRRADDAKRRAESPWYRAENALRCRLYTVLKGCRSKKSRELIGCNTDQLRKHIESQWVAGMSWENYGFYGWHIDHIKPVADFNLLDPIQQQECFHYTNLRPLWAEENLTRRFKVVS